jgi:hypothetical protein
MQRTSKRAPGARQILRMKKRPWRYAGMTAMLIIGGAPFGLQAATLHAGQRRHQAFCEAQYKDCADDCWYLERSPRPSSEVCGQCRIGYEQCLLAGEEQVLARRFPPQRDRATRFDAGRLAGQASLNGARTCAPSSFLGVRVASAGLPSLKTPR